MPDESWNINKDDSRMEDSIATYIIFCEDENSEPIYFESLQIDRKLKINIVPNQNKGKLNLYNTIKKCFQDGLMEVVNGKYKLKEGVTENIWCVYDRDLEDKDLTRIRDIDDLSFTTAISAANDAGLNVAWSNDAFELWVLLHFDTLETGNRVHRDIIYHRLTEIFKRIPIQSVELSSITSTEYFFYKWHLKTKNNFKTHVLPLLKERTNVALEKAKALEALYTTDVPNHDRNPCTMVHHLVQELLAFDPQ